MQLLKRFGIYVYTKDRVADLEIMEEEIKELYAMQMIYYLDKKRIELINLYNY